MGSSLGSRVLALRLCGFLVRLLGGRGDFGVHCLIQRHSRLFEVLPFPSNGCRSLHLDQRLGSAQSCSCLPGVEVPLETRAIPRLEVTAAPRRLSPRAGVSRRCSVVCGVLSPVIWAFRTRHPLVRRAQQHSEFTMRRVMNHRRASSEQKCPYNLRAVQKVVRVFPTDGDWGRAPPAPVPGLRMPAPRLKGTPHALANSQALSAENKSLSRDLQRLGRSRPPLLAGEHTQESQLGDVKILITEISQAVGELTSAREEGILRHPNKDEGHGAVLTRGLLDAGGSGDMGVSAEFCGVTRVVDRKGVEE